MSEKLNIKVLGVVENMSYVVCGKCGDRVRVFSRKSAEEQAVYLGVSLLAEMPINLELVDSMEEGNAEIYAAKHEEYKALFDNFIKNLCNK